MKASWAKFKFLATTLSPPHLHQEFAPFVVE